MSLVKANLNTSRNRAWKMLIAAGSALLAVSMLQAVAGADSFPDNYDTRLADSTTHTFCYESSFTTSTTVGKYGMIRLDNSTDMDYFEYSTCANNTDVWWMEADLAPGKRGSRTCAVPESSSRCNRSNITLDFVELDVGANDWHDRRKTALHEVGHSVGLNHDEGSTNCMRSGEVPSTAYSYRSFSSHDENHIDTEY